MDVAAGDTVVLQVALGRAASHLEGLVVTGTAFADSPLDAPYSVSVAGRRALAEQGSPTAVDFFRNLGSSAGVLGYRQGRYTTRPASSVSETTASVNLRGIGPSRTLVLLNGRRQVYLPARLAGGRFVDVNAFPSIALDRIEIVKEGASAVYGSGAVAGVTNFLTRGDFEGLETSVAHEWFAGSGESLAGAIWGKRLDERARAVVSAEVSLTGKLSPDEREWALRDYRARTGGWSSTGNPGAFLFPILTGGETPAEFAEALRDAHRGRRGGVYVDPQCNDFGGHLEGHTCRFSYQPWDDLLQASRQLRLFGEVNGDLSERTSYRAEALWAEAKTPEWMTTPSFPPISPYDGAQIIEPDHPGRREFCRVHGQNAGFADATACLADDWYFYGRLVGSSGPGRTLERGARTRRLAGSIERRIGDEGRLLESVELAAGYSASGGNWNLPAEYAYRKYLAFRGFGGPECGVEVVVDSSSPSGMALGPLGSAAAGEGDCMYYNPFSSAHERSAQPGSRYFDQSNPDHVAALANDPALIDWVNEEVNLENSARLLVGDAVVKGTLAEGLARYALGYQFRWLDVAGEPNEPGDLSVNPCPVLGDKSCVEKAGAFTFTSGHYEYQGAQTVHRAFVESRIELGARVGAQIAANLESHGPVIGFDPKVAVRLEVAGPVALRASVQTTMRTPSVDDLDEDRSTSREYVSGAGAYKAVDTYGKPNLDSERAFTYNVGATGRFRRLRATIDYWSYDFENVIDAMPAAGVSRLYDDLATREAVREFVTCPDGEGTGTCDAATLERVRVVYVNWPGIEMSGIDARMDARFPLYGRRGRTVAVSLKADGTYLRNFLVKALGVNGVELNPEERVVGRLNQDSPMAPPLPRLKASCSIGWHVGELSLVNSLSWVSGYENEAFAGRRYREYNDPSRIDRFATWDFTLLRRAPRGVDLSLSVLNMLNSPPPPVLWEQGYDGFTHSPKGRRVKVSATWRR